MEYGSREEVIDMDGQYSITILVVDMDYSIVCAGGESRASWVPGARGSRTEHRRPVEEDGTGPPGEEGEVR